MNFFKVDIPCIKSKRQESNTPRMKFFKTYLRPLIYQVVTGDLCSLQDLRDSGEFKDCDPVHMYVVNRPYA